MHNEVIPRLQDKYVLASKIFTRILHTAGIGESLIDERLGDLEELSNPTVGLSAHTGQVDIRISAKAESEEDAAELIDPIEKDIRKRLKRWIYGADTDTLEKISLEPIRKLDWKLVAVEIGFGGELLQVLYNTGPEFCCGEILRPENAPEDLTAYTRKLLETNCAQVGLAAQLTRDAENLELNAYLITADNVEHNRYNFGGPPALTIVWATNYCLNMLRNFTIQESGEDKR
jgi:hypothetical protein